jgi:hypothetical protein
VSAVTRDGWIFVGFVALAVAAFAVSVAGTILLVREFRSRPPKTE